MARSTTPLPKVNTERARKKAHRYAVKLGRYRNSRTYHLVEARAQGRCERIIDGQRCEESRANGDVLTHNHKTYARFGGKERPEDVEVLGPRCNALYEAARPWRRRGNVA